MSDIRPTDWAYLAGIIDGEGCICLHAQNKHVVLAIVVTNTDMRMMLWLNKKFGGKIHVKEDKRSEKYKVGYLWMVPSGEVVTLLEGMLPYLTCKVEQAIIALEFRQTVGQQRGNRKMPKYVFSLRSALMKKMKTLNKKGR